MWIFRYFQAYMGVYLDIYRHLLLYIVIMYKFQSIFNIQYSTQYGIYLHDTSKHKPNGTILLIIPFCNLAT